MSKITVEKGTKAIYNNAGTLLLSNVVTKSGILKNIPAFERGKRGPIPYRNEDLALLLSTSLGAGNPDFIDVEKFAVDPEFFGSVFDIKGAIPSESTVRQRANSLATVLAKDDFAAIVNNVGPMVTALGLEPTPLACGRVPVDIDVTTNDESKTSKEGIAWTYTKHMGYAPQMAYIGTEGYVLRSGFRKGSDHSQNGAVDFLKASIDTAMHMTDKPLLLRMDSGNDATENYITMLQSYDHDQLAFLVKRNFRRTPKEDRALKLKPLATLTLHPRFGKNVYIGSTYRLISLSKIDPADFAIIRVVFEIQERCATRDGQVFMEPSYEIDEYYTTLRTREASDAEVIELYHDRGTSEQFHSEIKTDMDLARLPSGKFDTNALIFHLNTVAFNALKIIERIGQEMPEDSPIHFRDTKRRRIKTIVENLIRIPGLVTTHARKITLTLGRCCPWADVFLHVYRRVEEIRAA